ncbi:MAG TPA: hypothetical protein VIL71_21135 [Spirillospora sp.]
MAAGRYEDDDLDSLRAPAHDVDALASVLSNPSIGGFDVRCVFNQPSHKVSIAIEEFFDEGRADDVLLLYVSKRSLKGTCSSTSTW